jgi:hypothetical protein
MWLVRLLIALARPCARGRKRFKVGPSLAYASFTTNSSVWIAPRKVRLVLDLIRGKNAGEAIAILKLTNKASSPVIEYSYHSCAQHLPKRTLILFRLLVMKLY